MGFLLLAIFMLTGLRAFLLTSSDSGRLQVYPDGAIVWNQSGRMTFVGHWKNRPVDEQIRWEDQTGKLVTPGFIDVHCHLPQYPVVASGGQELLPWLKKYIFPCERAFTPKKAETEAPLFFSELKRHGITSAAVYTTVNAKSTAVCFLAAEASKLRIVMGQMMMDVDSYAPKPHTNLTGRVLNESAKLCERWNQANSGRLAYAFSPRFALTCSATLLRESAKLAIATNAFIQTHLAENRAELIAVKTLFPSCRDYTHVYESLGLLGPRTIVGHAIYLSPREYRALAATATKVAHCPSSNLFLRSGVMAYDRMRENRITVGLASDVAAGPELNPWEVMKAASYGQNLRSCYVKNAKTLSPAELFHLATVSSAAVLGKQSEIGQLRKGFMADCALWDTRDLHPYTTQLPHDPHELVSLLIYRGARLEATKVWVAGDLVWLGQRRDAGKPNTAGYRRRAD
jgi:guanine deaminase